MDSRQDHSPDTACADHDAGQRGMALLVVLWIVASAALLVSAFNTIARSGASFVASEVQLSKTEALLEAGVEIAASQLLGEKEQRGWQADGRPHVVTYDGVDLVISVRDPNGLVDLNQADGELLLGLLRTQGASESEATRIRDAVLRARGEKAEDVGKKSPKAGTPNAAATKAGFDKPAETGGADKSGIGKGGAGASAPPRGSAADASRADADKPKRRSTVFVDPTQLRHIAGMSLRLYSAVAPFVTVYSNDGRINLTTAPETVLASIPNLARIDVTRMQDAAKSRVRGASVVDDVKQRGGDLVSDEAGPAYAVTVKLASAGRYRAAQEFVIGVGLDEDAPYRLVARRTIALAD